MGSPVQISWTADEDVVLRQLWSEGKRKKLIGKLLGRTASSVASRLRVLDIDTSANRVEPDSTNMERVNNGEQDLAFQTAMMAAISSGLEHARIGTVKDWRAPKPTRFPTRMSATGSFCGSAAQACAESV